MRYLGSSADQKDVIARESIDSKLAPVETSPATAAHTAGSLLLYSGTLYRATADIAVGATLTVGTNIAVTDLDEVASLLKSAINAKADKSTALTVTLLAASWSNNEQTANATGVTASNNVIVAPAPASQDGYVAAGIKCTAQGAGTLTFSCSTAPTGDLTVNVLIVG